MAPRCRGRCCCCCWRSGVLDGPRWRAGGLVRGRVGGTGWTGGGLSGSPASAVGLNGRLPRAGLRSVDRVCPWAMLRRPGQHVTQRPQTCAVACEPAPCPARPGGRPMGGGEARLGPSRPSTACAPAKRCGQLRSVRAAVPGGPGTGVLDDQGTVFADGSVRVLASDRRIRSVRSARGCRGPRWPEACSLFQPTSGRPDRAPQPARAPARAQRRRQTPGRCRGAGAPESRNESQYPPAAPVCRATSHAPARDVRGRCPPAAAGRKTCLMLRGPWGEPGAFDQ
jgi:hypothetical protein